MQKSESELAAQRAAPQNIQQRTFEFACRIVKLHDALRKKNVAPRLLSQLVASGTSIGANMQEAQSAQSKQDFIHKCTIALKEARETHFWLRVIDNGQYLSSTLLAPIIAESNELIAILVTIIKSTKRGLKP